MIDRIYERVQNMGEESLSKKLDPSLQIDVSSKDTWHESLLERLIRERRQMPKEERLQKFRNDSVDEVDTTDLESWTLRTRKPNNLFKRYVEEDMDEFEYKFMFDLEEFPDPVTKDQWQYENDRMLVRHRLDLAKLFLNKDGGYSLRKFKRIYKREMAENPHKWVHERADDGQAEEEVKADDKSKTASDDDDEEVVDQASLEPVEAAEPAGDAAKKSDKEDGDSDNDENIEEAKTAYRAKVKKEIDEMNADSEDETYEFEEEELE